jgi:hypothetical protein
MLEKIIFKNLRCSVLLVSLEHTDNYKQYKATSCAPPLVFTATNAAKQEIVTTLTKSQ